MVTQTLSDHKFLLGLLPHLGTQASFENTKTEIDARIKQMISDGDYICRERDIVKMQANINGILKEVNPSEGASKEQIQKIQNVVNGFFHNNRLQVLPVQLLALIEEFAGRMPILCCISKTMNKHAIALWKPQADRIRPLLSDAERKEIGDNHRRIVKRYAQNLAKMLNDDEIRKLAGVDKRVPITSITLNLPKMLTYLPDRELVSWVDQDFKLFVKQDYGVVEEEIRGYTLKNSMFLPILAENAEGIRIELQAHENRDKIVRLIVDGCNMQRASAPINPLFILPQELRFLTSLTHLTLKRGCLLNLEALRLLPKLQTLDIVQHPIETFLPVLSDLTSLRGLSLIQNGIAKIPPSISKLQNLVFLNLLGNPISSLPEELLEMPNLKLIQLNERFLSKESRTILAGLGEKGVIIHFTRSVEYNHEKLLKIMLDLVKIDYLNPPLTEKR